MPRNPEDEATSPETGFTEVEAGATTLTKVPFNRTLRQARRLAKDRTAEIAELAQSKNRKCKGKSKVRDPITREPILGPDGKALRKPCEAWAIHGGFVCVKHGGSAPQVKKRAMRRFNALVDPAMTELEVVMHQNEHMPSKLGAIRTVLERAGGSPVGALKSGGDDGPKQPTIVIGIMPGGIPNKQVADAPAIDVEVIRTER
jgi:hypothetical protein